MKLEDLVFCAPKPVIRHIYTPLEIWSLNRGEKGGNNFVLGNRAELKEYLTSFLHHSSILYLLISWHQTYLIAQLQHYLERKALKPSPGAAHCCLASTTQRRIKLKRKHKTVASEFLLSLLKTPKWLLC